MVRFGQLNKHRVASKVIKPNSNLDQSPDAQVREEADLPTLRDAENGTRNMQHFAREMTSDKWRPPVVDEDWYAFCQAFHTILNAGSGVTCSGRLPTPKQRSTLSIIQVAGPWGEGRGGREGLEAAGRCQEAGAAGTKCQSVWRCGGQSTTDVQPKRYGLRRGDARERKRLYQRKQAGQLQQTGDAFTKEESSPCSSSLTRDLRAHRSEISCTQIFVLLVIVQELQASLTIVNRSSGWPCKEVAVLREDCMCDSLTISNCSPGNF